MKNDTTKKTLIQKPEKANGTDTTKLTVGQGVFMRSGPYGGWGWVIEVAPTGVIVMTDPDYGVQLIRFDNKGNACDSSNIDIHKYKNVGEDIERNQKHLEDGKIPGTEYGPYKLYSDPAEAGLIHAAGERTDEVCD